MPKLCTLIIDRKINVDYCTILSIKESSQMTMAYVILVVGSEEEHTRYCFDIYDLNGDGMISREEMLTMLKTSLGRQGLDEDPDEGVKDLIDMTLKKLDKDKDGRVSFQDWSTTVSAEPLMMEAFGPCLPTERNSSAFMTKVEAEYIETRRIWIMAQMQSKTATVTDHRAAIFLIGEVVTSAKAERGSRWGPLL